MDVLIPFLTSTETPFFLLFVTLFVYFIRDARKRDTVCNKQLEALRKRQEDIYKMLIHEKSRKEAKKPNESK